MKRPSGSAVPARAFAVALLNTAPAAAAIVVEQRHSSSPLGGLRGVSIDVAAVDAPTLTISRPREGVFATHARLGTAARA